MYTTVLERTRDIGVLKSLGASKVLIVRALLTETTPTVASWVLRAGVGTQLPCPGRVSRSLSHAFDSDYDGNGFCAPGSLLWLEPCLAQAIPRGLASRKDPVEALSYD